MNLAPLVSKLTEWSLVNAVLCQGLQMRKHFYSLGTAQIGEAVLSNRKNCKIDIICEYQLYLDTTKTEVRENGTTLAYVRAVLVTVSDFFPAQATISDRR